MPQHDTAAALVIDTPTTARADVRVANRLRQLRLDKGLTLKGLSDLAGISQPFLSRIENHKTAIPITGLEQLATALGVPMTAFFEEDERTNPITICYAGKGKQGRLRGPRGFKHELLAADKQGKLMEPLILDIASASAPMALKSHAGEEFNLILEGECVLIYGKQELRLRQGDCAYYDANVPHAAHAVKGKPCRLLTVVASRDYLFHGDLSQLLNGTVK